MATDGGVRRTLTWAVCAVFAAQAGLTLGAYIDHRGHVLDRALRLYATPVAIDGASAAVRAAMLDPTTGRAADVSGLRLSVSDPEVEVTEPVDLGDAFVVAHAERVPARAFAWEAEVPSESGIRAVRGQVEIASASSWLDDPRTYDGPSSERRPNLSVSAGDQPGLWVRSDEDECPLVVRASVTGGVAPVGLPSTVLVRFTDPAGSPVGDLFVSAARDADGAPPATIRARTDGLGIAELAIVPQGAETWELAFDCRGESGSRRLEIVPSWDGLVLVPTRPTVASADEVAFSTVHQRRWGDWHQDVYCDGAWLVTQTTPVPSGNAVLGYPDLHLPASTSPRLCMQQGFTILLSPDPPRSVGYFLVRAAGETERESITALARRAARLAPRRIAEQLGPDTLARLEAAPEASVARFGRWLLDSLPQRFMAAPLLVDDAPAASAAFAERHAARTRLLATALGLDALVLALGVFSVIVPAAVRQRRALRMLAAELDDPAEPGLDGAGRTVVTLVVGTLAIGTSLLGIAVLLTVMR